MRSLNLLVLLLPAENRATLRALLQFTSKLVEYQQRHDLENKMTEHNVAMIIAPSLFPPRYIYIYIYLYGGSGGLRRRTRNEKCVYEKRRCNCVIALF